MSKTGSKGTAGAAMAILIFVKPDVLPDLTVTLPMCLLYACTQQPHKPHSLISTGEHGQLLSWAFGPERLYMGLIASRNSTLTELKSLYVLIVHKFAYFCGRTSS